MRFINLPRLRLFKEYTTHIPVVIKMIQQTDGGVLELGSGPFSTPLIHWLCQEDKREIYTFEEDQEYYQFARQFRSRNHHVRWVEDWDKLDYRGDWSVALIDHSENRRAIDAIKLKDRVDFIIIHDTDIEERYNFGDVWPHFKYRYTWEGCRPWTTIVSNKKEIVWE